jgi:hypothetical protein
MFATILCRMRYAAAIEIYPAAEIEFRFLRQVIGQAIKLVRLLLNARAQGV